MSLFFSGDVVIHSNNYISGKCFFRKKFRIHLWFEVSYYEFRSHFFNIFIVPIILRLTFIIYNM